MHINQQTSSAICTCVPTAQHMHNNSTRFRACMVMRCSLHEHAVSTKGEDDVGGARKEVVDRSRMLILPRFGFQAILDSLGQHKPAPDPVSTEQSQLNVASLQLAAEWMRQGKEGLHEATSTGSVNRPHTCTSVQTLHKLAGNQPEFTLQRG